MIVKMGSRSKRHPAPVPSGADSLLSEICGWEPEPGVWRKEPGHPGQGRSRWRKPVAAASGRKRSPDSRRSRDTGRIDIPGTIAQGWRKGRQRPRAPDLLTACYVAPQARLVILVLDLSDSMLQALELIRSWLRQAMQAAYFRRDPLALVLVQGGGSRLLAPPSTSLGFLLHKLRQVRVGGATPLDQGLIRTAKLLRQWRQRYPIIDVILVTDGRSTAPLQTASVDWAAAAIRRNTRQVTVVNPVQGSGEAAGQLAGLLKGSSIDVHGAAGSA